MSTTVVQLLCLVWCVFKSLHNNYNCRPDCKNKINPNSALNNQGKKPWFNKDIYFLVSKVHGAYTASRYCKVHTNRLEF